MGIRKILPATLGVIVTFLLVMLMSCSAVLAGGFLNPENATIKKHKLNNRLMDFFMCLIFMCLIFRSLYPKDFERGTPEQDDDNMTELSIVHHFCWHCAWVRVWRGHPAALKVPFLEFTAR